MKKATLRESNYGHVGYVGRQPAQCLCLLCKRMMTSSEQCPVSGHDREAFLRFVVREKRWRMLASAIREDANPASAEEQAVYRVANVLGPRVLATMKLDRQTAADVLARGSFDVVRLTTLTIKKLHDIQNELDIVIE